MHCDLQTGVCETEASVVLQPTAEKPVRLLYFSDPICSTCWGIEPQLRKLKQEYGHYFSVEYRMGGLLKSWSEYAGKDVSGPTSVAKHWEEVAAIYNMPIDGSVWLEDPLDSSYPAAIAFKAAQLQGDAQAAAFLRRIKEMVFLERKNITRLQHLLQAATDVQLDEAKFKADLDLHATALFEEDLQMARSWGVKGFPTIFFIDEEGNRFKVYGSKPYEVYEDALRKLLVGAVEKKAPESYATIFRGLATTTLQEFAVFYGLSVADATTVLQQMEEAQRLQRLDYRVGSIWKCIDDSFRELNEAS